MGDDCLCHVEVRENCMVDRCVKKDSWSCDPSRITTRGTHPHAPVNHTVFFLCHSLIKFMYINKILMKTRIFLYYVLQCELLCVQTSESGFYQWVWILLPSIGELAPESRILQVGLDFASGSGYENPMGQTPCYIM